VVMNLGKSDFDNAVKELKELCNALALSYLPQTVTRELFKKEILEQIRQVSYEIEINCLSIQGGVEIITREISQLKLQEFDIVTGRAKQYAAVEKKVWNDRANLFLKQVGFVSGGSQVFAGFGVCAASLGVACAAYGSPLIAHGMNNAYENGYYLLYRTDKMGYTRQAYRKIAGKLGYSNGRADIVYAAIDIGLSGYGMARAVPKPGTWRLFNNINSDFIRGWVEMGRVPLAAELIGDVSTGYSIHQLTKEK